MVWAGGANRDARIDRRSARGAERRAGPMRPITFTCEATLPLTAADVAGRILDVDAWSSFAGYGPLPGIESAAFEVRTPDVVGSRIRVRNTDGSSHVEEIVGWEPDRRVRMVMTDFTPPLSRLATRFEETWTFQPAAGGTKTVRAFELHPTSAAARPLLWLISRLLRRAVARHLRELGPAADAVPAVTTRPPVG
jgi:hypothetical protein